jgi:hypothetical protein
MIGDYYGDKWREPNVQPNPAFTWNHPHKIVPSTKTISIQDLLQYPSSTISREEFDSLKKEVLEMKELLKRALDYDKRNNEPNCEMEEKVALLKKVAEYVGVTLEDVFPNK